MLTIDDVTVLVFAFRYAIGRRTCAPGLICDYITNKIPEMSEQQIKEVTNEVTKALEYGDYADSIALDEAVELLYRLRLGNIRISDWFYDDEGEQVWAQVNCNNRYAFWGCKTKDVFPDNQAFHDDREQGKKFLLGKIIRDGFDLVELPHIEDASPAMQQLWKNIMNSDNNMWFVDDTPEDGEWEELGLSKDEYQAQIDADILRYHLKDVITKHEDESIMYTCYGDLQSRFSGPIS